MERPDDGRRRVAVWPLAHVEARVEAGTLVVRIHGEVDLANAARVERVVNTEVARERPRTVLVDLELLEYLDGAGRSWLRRLDDRLALCGIGVEVIRPVGGAAARMFDLLWPVSDERPGIDPAPLDI